MAQQLIRGCASAMLAWLSFMFVVACSGCATMGALSDFDKNVADIVDRQGKRISETDLEDFLGHVFDPTGRLAKTGDSAKPLPNASPPAVDKSPSVKGDPEVTLATGERFRYEGRAVFVKLSRYAEPELFLVDVRSDSPDYISAVWRRTGRDNWEVFRVPDNDRLLEVPLATDARFLKATPPSDVIDSFADARVFLAFEGGVIPGPSFRETQILWDQRLNLIDRARTYHERNANALAFHAALAHFRKEEFRPCEHLKSVGRLLLLRFLELSRT